MITAINSAYELMNPGQHIDFRNSFEYLRIISTTVANTGSFDTSGNAQY